MGHSQNKGPRTNKVLAESSPALEECLPPMDLTHHKALGKGYPEPNHKQAMRCKKGTNLHLLHKSGGDLTSISRDKSGRDLTTLKE